MPKTLPCPTLLRQLLRYEPDTGKLFWLYRPDGLKKWNTRYADKEAFTCTDAYGYRIGNLQKVGLKAHRVIWAMVHGEWPEHDIDHINGCRSDNRLVNLRHATRAQNLSNQRVVTGSSGYKGVKLFGTSWVASYSHMNKGVHVGCYGCPTKAAIEYDKAVILARGEFAVPNLLRPRTSA